MMHQESRGILTGGKSVRYGINLLVESSLIESRLLRIL
jgi:hypothetical protein